jgi:hypothetical protein
MSHLTDNTVELVGQTAGTREHRVSRGCQAYLGTRASLGISFRPNIHCTRRGYHRSLYRQLLHWGDLERRSKPLSCPVPSGTGRCPVKDRAPVLGGVWYATCPVFAALDRTGATRALWVRLLLGAGCPFRSN